MTSSKDEILDLKFSFFTTNRLPARTKLNKHNRTRKSAIEDPSKGVNRRYRITSKLTRTPIKPNQTLILQVNNLPKLARSYLQTHSTRFLQK
jgi:hypothetical protein